MITGANVGIGFETAKEMLVRGGKVIILCRNEEKMTKAKEELQKSISGHGYPTNQSLIAELRGTVPKVPKIACVSLDKAKHRLMEF